MKCLVKYCDEPPTEKGLFPDLCAEHRDEVMKKQSEAVVALRAPPTHPGSPDVWTAKDAATITESADHQWATLMTEPGRYTHTCMRCSIIFISKSATAPGVGEVPPCRIAAPDGIGGLGVPPISPAVSDGSFKAMTAFYESHQPTCSCCYQQTGDVMYRVPSYEHAGKRMILSSEPMLMCGKCCLEAEQRAYAAASAGDGHAYGAGTMRSGR